MPLKIAMQSIKVRRKGTDVWTPVGQPFDFTDDEISEIEQTSPDALAPVDVGAARALVAAADGEKADDEKAEGKPAPRQRRAPKPDDSDDL